MYNIPAWNIFVIFVISKSISAIELCDNALYIFCSVYGRILFISSSCETFNDSNTVFMDEPDSMKGKDFIEKVDINMLDYKHKER